jgi:hypothetical protein
VPDILARNSTGSFSTIGCNGNSNPPVLAGGGVGAAAGCGGAAAAGGIWTVVTAAMAGRGASASFFSKLSNNPRNQPKNFFFKMLNITLIFSPRAVNSADVLLFSAGNTPWTALKTS